MTDLPAEVPRTMPQSPRPQARTLDDIALPNGTFAIVAMDQRNTLKRMYAAAGAPEPSEQELVDIKADAIGELGETASGFLLDPTYGIPALDQVAHRPGVLLATEPSVRDTWQGEPRATSDPSLNAEWVIEQGADALKFFIQMRPGRPVAAGAPDLREEWLELAQRIIADCARAGIPSVIENLFYPIPNESPLSPDERADEIIEAARLLGALKPDLLKLEYPGSPAACRRLADAIDVPWAVLSAGVAFDEFTDVLRVACDDGGASGFIAGRAIWRETVGMPRTERRKYLADEGRRRLDVCVAAIDGRAQSWKERS